MNECLTTPQHEKQIGYWVSEKSKRMEWGWVEGRKDIKEGNVLFNDALNTLYLRLYVVGHMVKNHSGCER